MARGVSEVILRAVHESGDRQLFENREVETLKNSVFVHFWKIVELNTDVLEPSLLSEIDICSLKGAQSQIDCVHS